MKVVLPVLGAILGLVAISMFAFEFWLGGFVLAGLALFAVFLPWARTNRA